jgi:hypothetical protein
MDRVSLLCLCVFAVRRDWARLGWVRWGQAVQGWQGEKADAQDRLAGQA